MVRYFEVGKKYTWDGGKPIKCVAIDVDGNAIGLFAGQSLGFMDGDFWDEYVEPKIEVVKKTICRGQDGYISVVSDPAGQIKIGRIEVTLIDGKVDSVKVV